ncbi:MAG: hypothetical protein G01um101430_154 [Parcubacteria group bacterium Gr01-1014_30]|nr:MAG: hypothetical protein G01um101430_154 [Parcubacteria group bacterium Gr01-1014_30]
MKKVSGDFVKKIRTREDLILVLDEIAQKKLKNEVDLKLEKKLKSLPEIKLEIAFSPKDNFLNKISEWLEKESGQKVILNLTINPKIVAGAIIEYQGNWRDFSLAGEIDKFFLSNHGEF